MFGKRGMVGWVYHCQRRLYWVLRRFSLAFYQWCNVLVAMGSRMEV